MKKDKVVKLLNNLWKCKLTEEDIDILLKQEESILDYIANLEGEKLKDAIKIIKVHSKTEDILRALDALEKSEYYNPTLTILTSENAKDAGITFDAVDVINKAKEKFNAIYASKLFTYSYILGTKKVLEMARIINEAKKEFNAKYAYSVLTNELSLQSNDALDGARLINEAKKEFNARYAYFVLTNELSLQSNDALDGARLINEASDEYNAMFISLALRNENANKVGCALHIARIVANAEHKFNNLDEYALRMNMTLFIENMVKNLQKEKYYLAKVARDISREESDEVDVKTLGKRINVFRNKQ